VLFDTLFIGMVYRIFGHGDVNTSEEQVPTLSSSVCISTSSRLQHMLSASQLDRKGYCVLHKAAHVLETELRRDVHATNQA
jgi:hypothetical protein